MFSQTKTIDSSVEVTVAEMKIPLPQAGETAEQYHQRLINAGFAGVERDSVPVPNEKVVDDSQRLELQDQFISAVPETTTVGNITLRERLTTLDPVWGTDVYWLIRQRCIDLGLLRAGRGRGGSVSRVKPVEQAESDTAADQRALPPGIVSNTLTAAKVGLEKGLAAYKEGNFAAVLLEWGNLAEQGDIHAQYNLALLYYNGRGVTKSLELAYQWFKKAAEQGHAKAQLYLAGLFESGEGTRQDDILAELWYRKAAEKGNADAQYKLGRIFENGIGVKWDDAEVKKWYLAAAQQGHSAAQYRIGCLYRLGSFCDDENNHSECIKWFRLAADQGHMEAQCALGAIYGIANSCPGVNNTNLAKPDDDEALKWWQMAARQGSVSSRRILDNLWADSNSIIALKKAAEQGDASAQNALGVHYLFEEVDELEAIRCFKQSANQGHSQAQKYLGYCFSNGKGASRDYVEAIKWYRSAADGGDRSAMDGLGTMYASGDGVPRDYLAAAKWFELAAAETDEVPEWYELYFDEPQPQAQLHLGLLYENGLGVKKNLKKASSLYRKSGNEEAQYNLALVFYIGKDTPQDFAGAYRLVKSSAELKYPPAQWLMGFMMENGEGIPRDYIKAIKNYRLAAELFPPALRSLGAAYADGLGVPQNLIAAYALFSLAISEGDETATKIRESIDISQIEIDSAQRLTQQMSESGDCLKALDRFIQKSTSGQKAAKKDSR